jgi:predicted Zn-dependent protease
MSGLGKTGLFNAEARRPGEEIFSSGPPGLRVKFFSALRAMQSVSVVFFASAFLTSCATNPATGNRQFTALMSPAKEASQGAEQNEQIEKLYGAPYRGTKLEAYVESVGQRVAKNAERKDVTYRFAILDSPAVNAFALPGGYIYVTRGLLALANSEDELAGVLAHETGHVAARHVAERYSQGVLASFGAAAIALALESPDASGAAGLGSSLYTASYSRGQETEADALGVRYLAKAGYDPLALSRFLDDMDRYTKLQGQADTSDFFANHPQTVDRVKQAALEAAKYPAHAETNPKLYLAQIDGLVYGDSPAQGFIRNGVFYHPGLGVTFAGPAGFALVNGSDRVVARGPGGAILLFDGTANPRRLSPAEYLSQVWLRGEKGEAPVALSIGGHDAATASFTSSVNGKPMRIRLIAVAWGTDRFYRFQVAMPEDAPKEVVNALKSATFSLRAMTPEELKTIQSYRVAIVVAKPGDTAEALAARTIFDKAPAAEFRALNGMTGEEPVVPGREYKIIK